MNKIDLSELELKTFIEQDALNYCQINNINLSDITELCLQNNQLTDISGVKIFKNLKILFINENKLTDISAVKYLINLKILWLSNNKVTDISVLKDLKYLQELFIINLRLESDQIEYINSIKNLKELWCEKGFKDMSVLNKLNNNLRVVIDE